MARRAELLGAGVVHTSLLARVIMDTDVTLELW